MPPTEWQVNAQREWMRLGQAEFPLVVGRLLYARFLPIKETVLRITKIQRRLNPSPRFYRFCWENGNFVFIVKWDRQIRKVLNDEIRRVQIRHLRSRGRIDLRPALFVLR